MGITTTELRVLQLKNNRILKFYCRKCCGKLNNDNVNNFKAFEGFFTREINNLKSMIELQNETIKKQNETLQKLIQEINSVKGKECTEDETNTFADRLKTKNETLVIKPKEKQQSNKTKDDLKQNIDPKSLAVGVENLIEGKEGTVYINCDSRNSKEKIRNKVENELGNQYKVMDGRQKNPKMIVRGVEEEYITEDVDIVIQTMKEQNELETTEDTVLKVLARYRQKGQQNKGNIILEVDVALQKKLRLQGKLNLGWRRCAANCQNFITCFNCAENHKTGDCASRIFKCINCFETNTKLGKSLDFNHKVSDVNCPCYKRLIDIESRKTKCT